jgi:hypothetical protein
VGTSGFSYPDIGHVDFHKETPMSFKDDYPEYAAIEHLIRRAQAERAVAIATMLANGLARIAAFFTRATESPAATVSERSAIESDSFVKRWVPKY